MPPSPKLQVERDALASDAKTWDQAAHDLDPPRNVAAAVPLNAKDVGFMGALKGIHTDYELVRITFDGHMAQAATYFRELGDQLRSIAAFYEQQEQASATRFNKIVPGGTP